MYEMRNITKIDDSSAYFWDRLDELNDPKYVPSDTDILKCRHRNKGPIEAKYEMFSIISPGGQRSERIKWKIFFDNVSAVIFVASLSCYDEALDENGSENSMTDQLVLFAEICNDKILDQTPLMVFLTKKDLFADKIKRVPLTKCIAFID
eukprot:94276_1